MKDVGATDLCAWRKIPVDPRELQAEICEGLGSSMGERVIDGGHRTSRAEYLGRIMAVENDELEGRKAAVEKATSRRDKYAINLQENQGVLGLMEKELKKYQNSLEVAKAKELVDAARVIELKEKVKVYKTLRKKKRKRVKAMETKFAALEETLSSESRLVAVKQMQVDGFRAKYAQLLHGAPGLHMRPLPLLYGLGSNCGGLGFIDVGECCLCGFSFPHSDIIVSNCRHVYHPWCALVVFSKGPNCCAIGCNHAQPIQWMMSFGWRGVHGWGRTGGGAKDWAVMMEESGTAISERLAARSVIVRASGLISETRGKLLKLCPCCRHDLSVCNYN